MNCTWIKRTALLALALQGFWMMPAQAQTTAQNSPSETSLIYARLIANSCPGQWETPACLSAVSKSNLALAANYGGALQEKNLNDAAEKIKQHCAASTAASDQEFPAYAMKSAFIECANAMSDVSDETKITPDLSHYQLLIGATMCLGKDPGCAEITRTLQQYAKP